MELKVFDYWNTMFNNRTEDIPLNGLLQRYMFSKYVLDEGLFPSGGVISVSLKSNKVVVPFGRTVNKIIPQSGVGSFEYYFLENTGSTETNELWVRMKDNLNDVKVIGIPVAEKYYIAHYLKWFNRRVYESICKR